MRDRQNGDGRTDRGKRAASDTHLVTQQRGPVRPRADDGRLADGGHRAAVTTPGRVAHESVDAGADAQPGTGRYTRSHSTGLDVFNNIGGRNATTGWSAPHTDTDGGRLAQRRRAAATRNGTIEQQRGTSRTVSASPFGGPLHLVYFFTLFPFPLSTHIRSCWRIRDSARARGPPPRRSDGGRTRATTAAVADQLFAGRLTSGRRGIRVLDIGRAESSS